MYTVHWVESAIARLADVWTASDSTFRAEITAASHRVDDALKVNPLDAGESRDAERRI